jgi:hypothetical protein
MPYLTSLRFFVWEDFGFEPTDTQIDLIHIFYYTCNYTPALQKYFDLCILRKEIVRPQSKFPPFCVCERSINSQVRFTYFPTEEWADRSREYINRSQKHECGNWDCSRTVSFLEIFVSNFRYCVFAVCLRKSNKFNIIFCTGARL